MIYFSGIGRLTRDPEVRSVGDGVVARFGLATNKMIKGKERPSFFDCEVWGRSAQFVEEHVHKGDLVQVMGELEEDKWENEGQKRSKVMLRIIDVRFAGGGKNKSETSEPKKAEVEDSPSVSETFEDVPF